MTHRRLLQPIAAALLVATALLADGGRAAEPSTFGESASVVVVEVPVQVLTDGQPVKGLRASDFALYDGGTKREITGFEVIDLSATTTAQATLPGAAPAEAIPSAGRRHILLFFDLAYSQRPYLERGRVAAEKMLQNDLHPSDLVSVGIFSPTQGARVLVGFTSDRQQVQLILDALAGVFGDRSVQRAAKEQQRPRNRRDPLALTVADIRRQGANMGMGNDTANGVTEALATSDDGTRGGGLAAEVLADIDAAYQAEYASARRAALSDLLGSLSDVADAFSNVAGQKYLFFLSEGFDRGLSEIRPNSNAAQGASRTLSDLNKTIETFRRSGWIIQSIDVGGLRQGGSVGEDSLFLLAEETGGELHRNTNDLAAAIGEVVEQTSYTYLLSFQPPALPSDGSYHRLRVELQGGAASLLGARVVHRPGYFAPKPFAKMTAAERQTTSADLILGGTEGGTARTSVLVVPQPGAPTPVLVEAAGTPLVGAERTQEIEAYAYAFDAQGGIADLFYQKVPLDLSRQGEALRRTGLKLYGTLDLPPGSYRLRLLVRNTTSGVYALSTTAVEVPAPAQAYLAPPLFPEPGGSWVYFRVQPPAGVTAPEVPFVKGDSKFMPMAAPVVAAGRPAALALLVWGTGPQVQLREQLLGADGAAVPGRHLSVAPPEPAAPGGPLRLFGTYDTSGLVPGSYRLRLTATDPASGSSSTAEIPLRVVG